MSQYSYRCHANLLWFVVFGTGGGVLEDDVRVPDQTEVERQKENVSEFCDCGELERECSTRHHVEDG